MDKQITALLQKRDEQALQEIRTKYGRLCESLACQLLGSHEDAEECVSDALLALWNTEVPIEPAGLKAYLLTLVRRTAIDRARTLHRQKRGGTQLALALDELSEIIPSDERVEETVDRRALTAALTAWLRTQPEKTCRIFMQRYYFADSVQTIAKQNGMRISAVKMTLLRARKRLREHLRKEGFL